MRQEEQRADLIRATLEIVVDGSGQTGLSPTASLRRRSDGLYWDGSSWDDPAATVTMTATDSSGMPGMYEYSLPDDGVDLILGSDGYDVAMAEATNDLREYLSIRVNDEVVAESSAYATVPVDHITCQRSLDLLVPISVSVPAPVHGAGPGGFEVVSVIMSIDGLAEEIDVGDLKFVEMGSRPSGGATTAVTGDPVFTAGSGPDGEDALSVPVTNSMPFDVGSFVRAVTKAGVGGHVYTVLDKPTGTSMELHCASGHHDIEDGDTLEAFDPTGTYAATAVIGADDLPPPESPFGTLRIEVVTVATGDGPKFDVATPLSWVREISLDLAGRGFTAG